MNININFGEHFYESSNSGLFYDLLITFISVFLGFLAALMINRLIDNRTIEKEKKNKEQNHMSHLRYLSQLLNSIIETYPKQAKEYLKLSIAIKINPLKTELPNLRATYDLHRLKNLDSKILRDAYFYFFNNTKNSIDSYQILFSKIDFLLMFFNNLIQQNENHRNFVHKDQSFIKECFEEIHYRLDLKKINIQKDNPNSFHVNPKYQYLQNFNNIYINNTKDIIDFNIIQNDYLQPLHDSISFVIKDDIFENPILILIKKALSSLKNIEYNSMEFASDMEQVVNKIKDAIEFLTKTNEELKRKTNYIN